MTKTTETGDNNESQIKQIIWIYLVNYNYN